jgi:uncharacterized phage protein (TIGR02216 family)
MTLGERAAELAWLASSLLGWRPTDFWNSTPAELAAALGPGEPQGEQMDRPAVERLLKLFPDNREN